MKSLEEFLTWFNESPRMNPRLIYDYLTEPLSVTDAEIENIADAAIAHYSEQPPYEPKFQTPALRLAFAKGARWGLNKTSRADLEKLWPSFKEVYAAFEERWGRDRGPPQSLHWLYGWLRERILGEKK